LVQAQPEPPPPVDAANITLAQLENEKRAGYTIRVALLSLLIALLVYAGVTYGEEPMVPTDVVVEETVVETPTAEEKPGRLRNAIRYLFKDDSAAIMAEAEEDYGERMADLEARERDVAELQRILAEQEAAINEAADQAAAELAVLEERIKALTRCVASAMGDSIGGGP